MIAQPIMSYGSAGQRSFPIVLVWAALLLLLVCLHAAPAPAPPLVDLVRALKDKDETIRAKAASALQKQGRDAASAVPALLRALQDPHPKVRDAAARALYTIQGKKALTPIVKALKAETEPDVRLLLVTLVREWCRDRGPEVEEIIPALIETMNLDYEKYTSAVEESWVVFVIIGPKGVSALVDLAKDKKQDPIKRTSAVDVLRMMRRDASKAIPALIELLQDSDDELASRAADTLRLIGAEGGGVVKALEEMGEQDRSMRRCVAAADALAEIDPNNKRLVPLMLKILKHGDRVARARGVAVAGRLGPRAHEAVPALLRELNDEDEYSRRDAVLALGAVAPADKAVLAALQKACRDPSPLVRKTAVEVTEKIRSKGRMP